MSWFSRHWKDIVIGLLLISTGTFGYLWYTAKQQKRQLTGALDKTISQIKQQGERLDVERMTQADLERYTDNVNRQLSDVQDQLGAMTAKFNGLTTEHNALKATEVRLRKDFETRTTEYAALQSRFDGLAGENQRNVAHANELSGKVAQLGGQLSEVTRNYNGLTDKQQALAQQTTELSQRANELSTSLRQANAQNQELVRASAESTRQMAQAQARAAQLQAQLEDLRERLKAAQSGGGGGQ